MMKTMWKKRWMMICALLLAFVFVVETPVQAASPSCSDLYDAVKDKCADGAKKVSKKASCTFLTSTYRKKVSSFYYATDNDQVYCVCIVKAKSSSDARKIKAQFKQIYRDKKNDSYLSSSQKKVVRAAQYGSSGKYVWYISMGTSTQNKKAEKALKKKL